MLNSFIAHAAFTYSTPKLIRKNRMQYALTLAFMIIDQGWIRWWNGRASWLQNVYKERCLCFNLTIAGSGGTGLAPEIWGTILIREHCHRVWGKSSLFWLNWASCCWRAGKWEGLSEHWAGSSRNFLSCSSRNLSGRIVLRLLLANFKRNF